MNVTAQPEAYLLELRILMSRTIAAIIGLVRKIAYKCKQIGRNKADL